MNWQLVVSCEHASNEVPTDYTDVFLDARKDLDSHRGWDPGSLQIARSLAEAFKLEPFIYPYTRLLIEPNRSMEHPELFSEYTKVLLAREKTLIIGQYYLPHRDRVEKQIRELTLQGPVVHLGIHTFTPVWNGKEREVDIGILYDPDRSLEAEFSEKLINVLREQVTDLQIRANQPYQGIDDGFTTYLRTKFKHENYLGIEIEVSQRLLDGIPAMSEWLRRSLGEVMRSDRDGKLHGIW